MKKHADRIAEYGNNPNPLGFSDYDYDYSLTQQPVIVSELVTERTAQRR